MPKQDCFAFRGMVSSHFQAVRVNGFVHLSVQSYPRKVLHALRCFNQHHVASISKSRYQLVLV